MTATTILIIVNVFAALSIIVLALMQQSKGDMGSAFGGGGSQSMFGSRGSANFLSRLTAIMCTAFFLSSLSLAYLYAQRAEKQSVIETGSVIEQSNDIPTIEGEATEIDSQVPTIDNDVPVIEAPDVAEQASDVVEQAADAVDEAANTVEESVEAITE